MTGSQRFPTLSEDIIVSLYLMGRNCEHHVAVCQSQNVHLRDALEKIFPIKCLSKVSLMQGVNIRLYQLSHKIAKYPLTSDQTRKII